MTQPVPSASGPTGRSGAAPTDRDTESRDLSAARRTLAIEADALTRLAEALDGDFRRAIEIILGVRGRVVVTGIGKSGHVARKIAATLASTGTPSFYVHPSEASHGDLGMVAREDALIALSNSGDTSELADILAFARRFAVPVIAVTSRAASTLGEHADVILLLPDAPEACPMGLAPTTSTTMMLALGDALAIALLERRGFTRDDYRELHPGGALGKRLIKVSDIMHADDALPLCTSGTRMADAILVMTAGSFGCVGVVDEEGTLIGIVTDGDLRRNMEDDLLTRTIDSVMTPTPLTIRAGALAAEALGTMNTLAITSLFVLDESRRPIGILHIHDCLRAGVA